MKSRYVFVISMLCASVALAEPPAPPSTETRLAVTELVNKLLLAPRQKAESKRSRFSRAAPVPVQRRVRVLDAISLFDGRGKEFVRFAIDERRTWNEQGPWQQDSIVGCAYLHEQQVFVRRGAAYLPASSLLGKDVKERPGACRPAPEGDGPVASARR